MDPTSYDPSRKVAGRTAAWWRAIIERRARRTGQLPEPAVAADLGIDLEGDFGKVDNLQCTDAFVVNVRCRLSQIATADDVAEKALHGTDDFGHAVDTVPISMTSANVSVAAVNALVRVISPDDELSLGSLLKQVGLALQDLVYPRAQEFDVDPMAVPFDRLETVRVAWICGDDSWTVVTRVVVG